VVVEGDDPFAISERFKVPVETLKSNNALKSATVKPGEKLAVGPAHAHQSASHQAAAKKPISKMTCEDFVSLDESFQPKAVYWAVAYGSQGQPEAEAIEVDGIEKVWIGIDADANLPRCALRAAWHQTDPARSGPPASRSPATRHRAARRRSSPPRPKPRRCPAPTRP